MKDRYGEEEAVVLSFLPTQGTSMTIRESGPSLPLVERIRDGLLFAEFEALIGLLQIPEEELGRLLGISPATLHRRKRSGKLGSPESERVVRFARLFGLASEVLESEEAARSWLKATNPGTAGEAPLAYADTEFGAREVEHLLGRLDHGVF